MPCLLLLGAVGWSGSAEALSFTGRWEGTAPSALLPALILSHSETVQFQIHRLLQVNIIWFFKSRARTAATCQTFKPKISLRKGWGFSQCQVYPRLDLSPLPRINCLSHSAHCLPCSCLSTEPGMVSVIPCSPVPFAREGGNSSKSDASFFYCISQSNHLYKKVYWVCVTPLAG